MATIEKFEDLKVWQKARILCKEIHSLTSINPFSRDFALRDQINRSSGSIMDNIAEGFGRRGNLEFINFLTYACGSISECRSQLHRASDKKYLTEEKSIELFSLSDEIEKMLSSFIAYLRESEIKGIKFKGRK